MINGRYRLWIFLTVWVIAQALMLLIYFKSVGTDNSPNLVPLVAFAGAPLGPFAGGVARFSQSDCMQFSIRLLPWFLPFLLVAVPGFLTGKHVSGLKKTAALAAWAVGLFGWMIGGTASLGFALG